MPKARKRMVYVPICWKQKERKHPTYCSILQDIWTIGDILDDRMKGVNIRWPWRLQQLAWDHTTITYQQGPQPHHLQCITEAVESILRQEQVGVRKGRSCTDHIIELRTAITRAVSGVEHCCICCINFEDFEKAFDSIHRESLWKTLRHYGIPQKLIYIIQSLWELRVPSDPQQPSRRALRSEHLSPTRMYSVTFAILSRDRLGYEECYTRQKTGIAEDTALNPRGPWLCWWPWSRSQLTSWHPAEERAAQFQFTK